MNQHNLHQKNQLGFTLIELMVVLVILSIFAGFVSLSVSSTDTRKNKAFYEHFVDTLKFVRLVSAERMQPLGVGVITATNDGFTSQNNKGGQLQALMLDNAYASYQINTATEGDLPKNAMELSSLNANTETTNPEWVVDTHLKMPDIPKDVEVIFLSNQLNSQPNTPLNKQPNSQNTQQLQSWFVGGVAPSVMWFGTGQATPMMIEIRYRGRLVDEVIYIQPDGSVQIGAGQFVDKPVTTKLGS